MVLSDQTFLQQAWTYDRRNGRRHARATGEDIMAFRSNYGLNPEQCVSLWKKIRCKLADDVRSRHLLWSLFFLKTYNTETVSASKFMVTRKTYRKYLWKVVKAIAKVAPDVVSCRYRTELYFLLLLYTLPLMSLFILHCTFSCFPLSMVLAVD